MTCRPIPALGWVEDKPTDVLKRKKNICFILTAICIQSFKRLLQKAGLCLHCKKLIEPQIHEFNWIFQSAELPNRRVKLSATLLPAQDKMNAECRFLNVGWSITWTSGCLHLLSLGIFGLHITLFAWLATHVSFSVIKSQPRLCPSFERGPVLQVCSEHAFTQRTPYINVSVAKWPLPLWRNFLLEDTRLVVSLLSAVW